MSTIGPTLEAYFANRLVSQRQASPRTINAYRDLWRLLLHFACQRSGKTASKLDFGNLEAAVIAAFLTYLEEERGNTVRTRNTRLAAIHSKPSANGAFPIWRWTKASSSRKVSRYAATVR